MAALTGTGKLEVEAKDQEALRQFVAVGGTLVIDAAGGSAAFAKSAEQMLKKMYGKRPRRLAITSGLYRIKGMEIDRVRYRRRTISRLGTTREGNLRAIVVKGRPAVIFSPQDITAGLVGCAAYTIDGYDPGDGRDPGSAFRIMRNIILFAANAPMPLHAPLARGQRTEDRQ